MSVYRDTSTSRALTTAELFRKWAATISKGLKEVGLLKTEDTGQINLETVELPAVSTFAGFEIWRFNDSNQSNDPIFFKIEYGLGTTTSRPALRMTMGTGSNGSGTLLNASGVFLGAVANTPAGTPELHICHVDGALVFLESPIENGTSTTSYLLLIERLRDKTGAVVTSGANMGWQVASSAGAPISTRRKNGTYETSQRVAWTGSGSSVNADGRKMFAAMFMNPEYPFISVLAALKGEVTIGDSGKATLFGKERSYRTASTAGSMTITTFTVVMGAGAEGAVTILLLNE